MAMTIAVGCSHTNGPAAPAAPTTGATTTVATTTVATTTVAATTVEPTLPATTLSPDSTFTGVLSPWACPEPAPVGARCHRLEVPANWSDPAGETVSLPIMVIPPTGPDRRPDAIVVPAGGPGGSGLEAAEYWWDPSRDIVLYDQRGTGRAEPSLDCPEFQSAWLANLQRADSFDVERTAIVDAYTACRVRLEAAGVDFDDYDTEANVRDLDAIRAALGYEQWNIWGFSYGARLTLAAMRSTPDSIRSVILDSVYDVTRGILAASRDGGERAFAELAVGCSEQPGCAAKHPDLAAEIAAVDRRYNDDPATVEVDLGDGNGPRTFLVTGDDIMSGLLLALYDATIIPLLPDLIGGLADGDTSILGEFVRRGVAMQAMFAAGMRLSVNCADNAGLDPRIDEDAIDDPGRLALLLTEPLCSEWPVEPTSPDFNVPIESDIPALVMAGRYDPVTPPAGTEAVADRLSNATFGLWPDRGHGVSGEPCSNDISTAFLEDPTASVDLECLAAIDGPAFG